MDKYSKNLNISSKHYKYILRTLGTNKARLIGGCVRDGLLGILNTDIDIATTLAPERVISILQQNNIPVKPTGIKFGTVTAFYYGEQFEITTLRRDIKCDGRRSEVIFSESFKEDAARRDFTINALSYDPFERVVYDYFSGVEDLKQRRIIFIGDARARIKEDYLRILRFFRFSALYAENFDPEALAACEELRPMLKTLAGERIKDEMDKLLKRSEIVQPDAFKQIIKSKILDITWNIKSFSAYELQALDNFYKISKIAACMSTKYALLFLSSDNISIKNIINLKFSKKESIKICKILDFLKDLSAIKTGEIWLALKKIWLNENKFYQQYLAAAIATKHIEIQDGLNFLAEYESKILPKFPINGTDLLKIGFSGKEINTALTQAKNIWIKSDFSLNKEILISKIKI